MPQYVPNNVKVVAFRPSSKPVLPPMASNFICERPQRPNLVGQILAVRKSSVRGDITEAMKLNVIYLNVTFMHERLFLIMFLMS